MRPRSRHPAGSGRLLRHRHRRARYLHARPGAAGHIQVLRAEQDIYDGDGWTPEPIWNGDQTDCDLNFGNLPQVVRIRLGAY